MFTPRFQITPEIAADLMQIEAVRRELSSLVIAPQPLASRNGDGCEYPLLDPD